MNPVDIPHSAPVELEKARLEALIRTVFEDGHYHLACRCSNCEETRKFLDTADLEFINSVSRIFTTCNHEKRT